jgi:hypothetical protein
LPLHQRRELVKTLLEVRIRPGQGVRVDPESRVVITHKIVHSLNEYDEDGKATGDEFAAEAP